MGKGFNNYMTKKFFHPSSKDNLKRVWMAEQKSIFEKKKQEDMLTQYQKEQDQLSNRALLGDEKAKLGLSFLYDAPPGMKRKEKEDADDEVKFEWQRKFNAPREAYAKGDEDIRDQPFGIEVRNVRCIKCRQWGHVNTDKICPFFGQNLTAEPPKPETSTSSLINSLHDDGFSMKRSIRSRYMEEETRPIVSEPEMEDPEVKFLKSLSSKQKKKLLKKLTKLQDGRDSLVSIKKNKKSKKKHRKKDSSDEDSSDDQRITEQREERRDIERRRSVERQSYKFSNSKPSKRDRSRSLDRYGGKSHSVNSSRRSTGRSKERNSVERYSSQKHSERDDCQFSVTRSHDRHSPDRSRPQDRNSRSDDRKDKSHHRSRSVERRSRPSHRSSSRERRY